MYEFKIIINDIEKAKREFILYGKKLKYIINNINEILDEEIEEENIILVEVKEIYHEKGYKDI